MSDAIAHQSLKAAQIVLAKKGRSFDWARRILGQPHADWATRLYAFCRYLDDLADEAISADAALFALANARQAIATNETSDPTLRDGLNLMQECGIEKAVVLELICGIASDLEPVAMADEATLLRYCYRVAGTVGLMMCRVLDVSDPAASARAIDLGVAMQLTNICRDVAVDAALGRRYLPATLVGELTPPQLAVPVDALRPLIRRSVASLLERAESYYKSGELGLPYLPLRARCGILVAARIYRAIGDRLRRRGYDYWSGRVVVPSWQKAAISTQALVVQPLRSAFWKCQEMHQTHLHEAFTGLIETGGQPCRLIS